MNVVYSFVPTYKDNKYKRVFVSYSNIQIIQMLTIVSLALQHFVNFEVK